MVVTIIIIVIIEQLFLILFLILFYLYLTFTVAKTTSEPGDMSSEGTQSDQSEGENLEEGAASKTESKLLSVGSRRAKMARKFWL